MRTAVPQDLSLKDMINQVAQVYPDHFLQRVFEQETPPECETHSILESLAAYLVKEFEELYDPNSDDASNLQRIITSLERTHHLIGKVIGEVKALSGKV